MTRTYLLALALLGAAACGGDDGGSSTSGSTPQEKANSIKAAYVEDHRELLEEMRSFATDENETELDAPFDPAEECEDLREPLTDEDKGGLAMFFGQMFIDHGTDVATFSNELEDYRQDVLATGVCD